MSRLSIRSSSKPDGWASPRPYSDANIRLQKHGPIQPMEEPGLFSRIFRWR